MKTRGEEQMFDLILGIAKADERIRAVILNGSRADRNAKKDCFQDYDIVYIVSDVSSFVMDQNWIQRFGELMILQLPEDWHSHPYDDRSNKPFTYLMQFMDGARIDLHLTTLKDLLEDGEPAVALLDKDQILPQFPEPTGECYFVKKPGEKEFLDCCNEFWWLCPYVGKELFRDGLPYAKALLEQNIRPELMKMLDWSIGIGKDFCVSTGKKGKYLKNYVSEEEWTTLLATYPELSEPRIWEALLLMGSIFREKALAVASDLGYHYPLHEDERVTSFLRHIRQMPRDSESIYC